MAETDFSKTNSFGIYIRKCCASCVYKSIDKGVRRCKLFDKRVVPSERCEYWKMDESLDHAGAGTGKVKSNAYLHYALNRFMEDNARMLELSARRLAGEKITVDIIREEYESLHGTIYLII